MVQGRKVCASLTKPEESSVADCGGKGNAVIELICRTGGIRPRRAIVVGLGVVAAPRANLIALMFWNFDANLVIFAIELGMRGNVSDRVLIAQLVANVLEGLVQVIDVVRKERAPAGFLRYVLQDLVAFRQMRLAVGGFVWIGLRELNPLRAGADGVNDHAVALRHLDGFRARVIGKIIVAVADENHDAADNVGLVTRRARWMA